MAEMFLKFCAFEPKWKTLFCCVIIYIILSFYIINMLYHTNDIRNLDLNN